MVGWLVGGCFGIIFEKEYTHKRNRGNGWMDVAYYYFFCIWSDFWGVECIKYVLLDE